MKEIPRRPAPLSTTGIGSLPHTQLEMAMQQALVLDIPYLPELPRRTPAESLAAGALEKLSGLRVAQNGSVWLDGAAWEKGALSLDAELDDALEAGTLEGFAPSASSCCAWPPFLWEVQSRKLAFAKVQGVGPATALAALAEGGAKISARLESQVSRLVLYRGIAMARAVRAAGAVPIVFLDEPLLAAVRKAGEAEQDRELEQLRQGILGLRNEGAITGLHCCGAADWAPLLRLGLDLLSFDATISLDKLLVERPDVERFLENGGWFGLGVVATDTGDAAVVQMRLDATLQKIEAIPKALQKRVLSQSLLTPACGLGARTVLETGKVFDALGKAQARLRAAAD